LCDTCLRWNLETAVQAQTGGTPPEQVTELVLDACKTQKVTGLDKFVNLEILTLNGCGLTTLEGFPVLQELKTLELADNQLADGCLEALQDAALINMNRLSLAGNRFQTLEALEPLSACVNLRDLDLFNCPVTEIEAYRDGVFEMIPGLKYLDGFDADDKEKPEDEDEDEEDEGDEDLLSSEVGEDDGEDDLGEDDDDLGEEGEEGDLGDLGSDDLGEEGEEGDLGEEGEEGESDLGEEGEEGESDLGEEGESDLGDEPEEEAAPSSKRQRR